MKTTKIELQNLTPDTSNPCVMGIAFDVTQNKDKISISVFLV